MTIPCQLTLSSCSGLRRHVIIKFLKLLPSFIKGNKYPTSNSTFILHQEDFHGKKSAIFSNHMCLWAMGRVLVPWESGHRPGMDLSFYNSAC